MYATGGALIAAQECTSRVFGLATESSGPLHAIMSTEVILVVLFFKYYSNETLSWMHTLCFLIMIAGTLTTALGESGKITGDNFGLALLWAMIALCFYACWTITTRIVSINGVYPTAVYFYIF